MKCPRDKPWKEIMRYQTDQVQLPIHKKGPRNHDINWIFAHPKALKKSPIHSAKAFLELG
jgi:hypothetical protein